MPRGEKPSTLQKARSISKQARWQNPELGRWDQRMGEEADPHEPTHFQDPDVAINEDLQPPAEGQVAPLSVRGPFGLFDNLRSMVSRYKLRYLADGFNLDLRYITPRLIAMGYPAAGGTLEKMTRNHVDEVERFIASKHNGKALVMNLVGEANECVYDFERFNVNQDCAFLDHGVPSMTIMQRFCQQVDTWLEADPANVVITHCKAGKGRTGVMICVYLLFKYPDLFASATDVMRFYSYRRMKQAKEALTVPSQRRYIGYFSQRFAAEPGASLISRIVIPNMQLKMSKLRLAIYVLINGSDNGDSCHNKLLFSSKGKAMGTPAEDSSAYIIFDFANEPIQVSGDILIKVKGRKHLTGSFKSLFELWFNTGYIDHTPMVFDKACLDGLQKKSPVPLSPDFHVQVLFKDKPRVSCSQHPSRQARVYCWDCSLPFLSVEASNQVHIPQILTNSVGAPELGISGPPHRFHPLIEEDCAPCLARRMKREDGVLGGHGTTHNDGSLRMDKEQKEFKGKSDENNQTFREMRRQYEEEAKSGDAAEAIARHRLQKLEEQRALKAERLAMEANRREGVSSTAVADGPIYGYPSVFCPETKQFICSWCSKHELNSALTRFSLPVIPPHTLRYTGCARQEC